MLISASFKKNYSDISTAGSKLYIQYSHCKRSAHNNESFPCLLYRILPHVCIALGKGGVKQTPYL